MPNCDHSRAVIVKVVGAETLSKVEHLDQFHTGWVFWLDRCDDCRQLMLCRSKPGEAPERVTAFLAGYKHAHA